MQEFSGVGAGKSHSKISAGRDAGKRVAGDWNEKRRAMMRRKMILCLTAGFLIFSASVLTAPRQADAAKIGNINQAKAKARQQVKNATVTEVDSDFENGKLVYEVQLYKGKKEYDLVYQASNGKLIEYGWEDHTVKVAKHLITKSTCKKCAKQKVKNASIDRITQHYEDGFGVYKVVMRKGAKKYTLEYRKTGGALIEYKWEIAASETSSKNKYIGHAKAKSIAQKKVPGASVVKVEFDADDDGIAVYEVEMIKGNYEYDLTIHAKSGKILEYDRDFND